MDLSALMLETNISKINSLLFLSLTSPSKDLSLVYKAILSKSEAFYCFLDIIPKKAVHSETLLKLSSLFSEKDLLDSVFSLLNSNFTFVQPKPVLRRSLSLVNRIEAKIQRKLPKLQCFEANLVNSLLDSPFFEEILETVGALRLFPLLNLEIRLGEAISFYSDSIYLEHFLNFLLKHGSLLLETNIVKLLKECPEEGLVVLSRFLVSPTLLSTKIISSTGLKDTSISILDKIWSNTTAIKALRPSILRYLSDLTLIICTTSELKATFTKPILFSMTACKGEQAKIISELADKLSSNCLEIPSPTAVFQNYVQKEETKNFANKPKKGFKRYISVKYKKKHNIPYKSEFKLEPLEESKKTFLPIKSNILKINFDSEDQEADLTKIKKTKNLFDLSTSLGSKDQNRCISALKDASALISTDPEDLPVMWNKIVRLLLGVEEENMGLIVAPLTEIIVRVKADCLIFLSKKLFEQDFPVEKKHLVLDSVTSAAIRLDSQAGFTCVSDNFVFPLLYFLQKQKIDSLVSLPKYFTLLAKFVLVVGTLVQMAKNSPTAIKMFLEVDNFVSSLFNLREGAVEDSLFQYLGKVVELFSESLFFTYPETVGIMRKYLAFMRDKYSETAKPQYLAVICLYVEKVEKNKLEFPLIL